MVEEDTTFDSEMAHTAEPAAFLAIEGDGLLNGRSARAPLWESSYQYDPAGNITGIATLANGESDTQSFSYDANGNMLARNDGTGSFDQVWDVENRLVQVTDNGTVGVTTFTYDADGSRVKTVKPDGTITYTPFPRYEKTIAGANATTRVTYMLGGQMTAMRVTGDPDPANNGLFYLHSDHLGSVSAMSDENGNLVGNVTCYTPLGDYRPGIHQLRAKRMAQHVGRSFCWARISKTKSVVRIQPEPLTTQGRSSNEVSSLKRLSRSGNALANAA